MNMIFSCIAFIFEYSFFIRLCATIRRIYRQLHVPHIGLTDVYIQNNNLHIPKIGRKNNRKIWIAEEERIPIRVSTIRYLTIVRDDYEIWDLENVITTRDLILETLSYYRMDIKTISVRKLTLAARPVFTNETKTIKYECQ